MLRTTLSLLTVVLAALSGCREDSPRAEDKGDKTPAKSSTKTPGTNGAGTDAGGAEAGGADAADTPDEPDAGSDGGASTGSAPLAQNKKRVTFAGSKGDQVPGYLWLPARKAGQKFPAVLLMYGIKGNKDDGDIARAAGILNASGFVAMTIDWPGTGDRGNIGNTDRIVGTNVMSWTVADYKVAYDYLQKQAEVDGQHMGYVGASMGAMTGLAFAAREPRVKAIVAIVPIPNPLWGADDPSARIKQLAPRPVLCISTDDNSDFSATVCNNVGAGGQKKALPGGHELEGFRDQVVDETKTFLLQHLK